MPRYDYKCPACGKVVEIAHPADKPIIVCCDDCEEIMKKQIGEVGIAFKGSGFYSTDYKKPGGGK